MIEMVVGLIVGYLVATGRGWSHDTALVAGVLLAIGLYLASCAVWDHWPCPLRWLPWHTKTASGPSKAFRVRRPCRLCGNGYYRRLGSRLLGRG